MLLGQVRSVGPKLAAKKFVMKKTICICLGILSMAFSKAQGPVSWTYSATKISGTVYEVRLKASIQDGWHLYAQGQPENFLGIPTTIKFNKHPLVVLNGKPKEIGKLEKATEPTLDIESWQYNDEVVFVQRVQLRNKVRTNISGSIEFQVCTDNKCLPPATVNFQVPVN